MSPAKKKRPRHAIKKQKAPPRQPKKTAVKGKKRTGVIGKKKIRARKITPKKTVKSARRALRARAKPGKSIPVQSAAAEKALAARKKDEKTLLDLYERGIKYLYNKNYQQAMELFERLIENYPEEIELTDRARNFMKISQSQGATRRQQQPKTAEEMFDVGVIEHNKTNFQRAIEHFLAAINMNPKGDYLHYALAASYAQTGDTDLAIRSLQKSMQLNAENRFLARNDPDFEPIRGTKEFAALVEAPKAG